MVTVTGQCVNKSDRSKAVLRNGFLEVLVHAPACTLDLTGTVRLDCLLTYKQASNGTGPELRAAAADHGTVTIYKTADDFNTLVRQGKQLEWIENQLRSLTTDSPGNLASKQ